jgi:hypothetical protein
MTVVNYSIVQDTFGNNQFLLGGHLNGSARCCVIDDRMCGQQPVLLRWGGKLIFRDHPC